MTAAESRDSIKKSPSFLRIFFCGGQAEESASNRDKWAGGFRFVDTFPQPGAGFDKHWHESIKCKRIWPCSVNITYTGLPNGVPRNKGRERRPMTTGAKRKEVEEKCSLDRRRRRKEKKVWLS